MEKRPEPRYDFRCEAKFSKTSGAAALPGVISDISLTGCYVETLMPEPVGTMLEVEFESNGSRIRIAGVVRVVHTSMGMGIEFTGVPTHVADGLQKLIRAQAAGA